MINFLSQLRAMREDYTMEDRRKMGQTLLTDTPSGPVELVHGKYLAQEFLDEHKALGAESDYVRNTVSPYRSDLPLILAAIQEDYIEVGENLAYAVGKWLEDCEQEARTRDRDVCREAERAMYGDLFFIYPQS